MTSSRPRPATGHAAGFSLVELMVALVLSMILAVALLRMQVTLGQQSMRNSDTGVRDTQARAAMDLITQDLSSAGFLFGGTQVSCGSLLTYNSNSGYVARHGVDALAASFNLQVPVAPALRLNYPPKLSATVSDVLITTASTGSATFNDSVFPFLNVAPNVLFKPSSSGVLPLVATTGLVQGDVAVLQVPGSGKRACLRVPVTTVTANASIQSLSGLMPASNYGGFATQLAGAGFSDPLTDANIFQSRLIDMGSTGTTPPTQTSIIYYIDGSATYPVLMRGSYSLLDDAVYQTQAIAAGVVSLQVLFGVDTTGTGATIAYQPASTVSANKAWDFVRSVKVALVTRTLTDDPSPGATVVSVVKVGAPFTDVNVPASTHHYVVQQTEIAARNLLWS